MQVLSYVKYTQNLNSEFKSIPETKTFEFRSLAKAKEYADTLYQEHLNFMRNGIFKSVGSSKWVEITFPGQNPVHTMNFECFGSDEKYVHIFEITKKVK